MTSPPKPAKELIAIAKECWIDDDAQGLTEGRERSILQLDQRVIADWECGWPAEIWLRKPRVLGKREDWELVLGTVGG
jgi:hypothetical protein